MATCINFINAILWVGEMTFEPGKIDERLLTERAQHNKAEFGGVVSD